MKVSASKSCIAVGLAICLAAGTASRAGLAVAAPSDPPKDLPLLLDQNFEDHKTDGWIPTDPKAWSIGEDGGSMTYMITGKSNYEPTVRSPLNISVRSDSDVKDFAFEAKMRSTTKEYGHRDMCVIFGYQDPTHYYYVHMATKADDHANSIFLVNGAPRVSIAKTRTDGTKWDDNWHTVRVIRKIETGEIAVYFDDMDKPIMTTVDKTFVHGKMGVGSFDDTGNFDDIKVWGIKAGN